MTNIEKIRKYRKEFRQRITDEGFKGILNKKEYIKRIKVTLSNLKKYYYLFPEWFKIYWNNANYFERFIIKRLLTKFQFSLLYYDDKMCLSFYDIYRLFKWLPLKNFFKDYLCRKTHFSYGFMKPYDAQINKKVDLIKDKKYTKKEREEFFKAGSNKNKFAEFVYILLCEYIVLHNYMWVSKLKPKGIKTIDKFMRNIK